ncbi:MAG TPA: cryptochrome/photolyase family protein, partial [Flavisolibacter sp.]|nr:cryptochrome/photolyase family protein [Flavisolibacter sp.]
MYLVEEALFFDQYCFHKKKLLFHRASMKYYESFLLQKGFQVTYVDAAEKDNDIRTVVANLPSEILELHYADVTDDWLHRRLQTAAAKKGLRLVRHRTPGFLNTVEETNDFFAQQSRYHQTDFYIHQRKTRKLLLDENGGPLGGKWSFDSENRAPYPRGNRPPEINLPPGNSFVTDAMVYVEKNYALNYGNTLPPFGKRAGFFPITHCEAEDWLTGFFQQRF